MAKDIYSAEDFEERLSELTIGTEDVQKLIAFVQMREATVDRLCRKLRFAESIIGEYELDKRLIEADHG